MKAKQQKRMQQAIVFFMVLVFVGGTLLLYLPVGQPNPDYTPPPLNTIPEAQQNQASTPGTVNAPAPQ